MNSFSWRQAWIYSFYVLSIIPLSGSSGSFISTHTTVSKIKSHKTCFNSILLKFTHFTKFSCFWCVWLQDMIPIKWFGIYWKHRKESSVQMHETYHIGYVMELSWSVGEIHAEIPNVPIVFDIVKKYLLEIGGYVKFTRLHVSFWNVFLSNSNKNHAAIINVPSIVLNNLSLSAFYGYYVVQAYIRSDCIQIRICDVFMYLYTHVILRNKMKKTEAANENSVNKTKQKKTSTNTLILLIITITTTLCCRFYKISKYSTGI